MKKARKTASVRSSFVAKFGKDAAEKIEAAANEHDNGVNSRSKGSDPFKWALCIAIGYECVSKYADYHKIKLDPEAFKAWVVKHGDLGSHDGDVDYLSALVGVYDEFMPKKGAAR